MAVANICDRCGAVYRGEVDVKKTRYHVFDGEKNDNSYHLQTYNGCHVGEILDLCDKCRTELETWLEHPIVPPIVATFDTMIKQK